MAREYAKFRTSMWGERDWKDLTPPAQHLYTALVTDPGISYCGVVDWRPNRIAARSRGWTASAVEEAAAELEATLHLLVDVDTEEALVRSFIRNDEVMKQPRLAVSMSNAHAMIASSTLQGVVVHELRRLHAEKPDLPGWKTTKGDPSPALAVLEREAIEPSAVTPVYGLASGSAWASLAPNATRGLGQASPKPTATTDVTYNPEGDNSPSVAPRTSRGTRLPQNFTPGEDLRSWARDRGFNDGQINEMTDRFADHWHSTTGAKAVKADWDRAWRNWVGKEDPRRVRSASTALYDASKLPQPGTGWSREQLDMVLGKDTWEVPEPPAEMTEDDGYLWQQAEGRRHFALRVQAALEATGRTA